MSYIKPGEENELSLETLITDLFKDLEDQKSKLSLLESSQNGLTTKLVSLTFGDDGITVPGTLMADNLITRLDINILGSSISRGNLSVIGGSVFNGNVVFNKEAEFNNDMVFNGLTTFSTDTAGLVTIEKGKKETTFNFTKEYSIEPMIFVDISLSKDVSDEDKKLITAALINNELIYTVKNKSTKGFTIELTENAPADIRFSWQAVNMRSTTTTTTR